MIVSLPVEAAAATCCSMLLLILALSSYNPHKQLVFIRDRAMSCAPCAVLHSSPRRLSSVRHSVSPSSSAQRPWPSAWTIALSWPAGPSLRPGPSCSLVGEMRVWDEGRQNWAAMIRLRGSPVGAVSPNLEHGLHNVYHIPHPGQQDVGCRCPSCAAQSSCFSEGASLAVCSAGHGLFPLERLAGSARYTTCSAFPTSLLSRTAHLDVARTRAML